MVPARGEAVSAGKGAGAAIIGALPNLISPVIEAIGKALEEGRLNTMRAELATVLEQSKLFEMVAQVNSAKALEYYNKSLQQEALIQKQDELIRTQAQTINDLRGCQ